MRRKKQPVSYHKHLFRIGIALCIVFCMIVLVETVFFVQLHARQTLRLNMRTYILFTAQISPNNTMTNTGFLVINNEAAIFVPLSAQTLMQVNSLSRVRLGSLYALQATNVSHPLTTFFQILSQNTHTYIDGYLFTKSVSLQELEAHIAQTNAFWQSASLLQFLRSHTQMSVSDADLLQIPSISIKTVQGDIGSSVAALYAANVSSESPRISIYNASGRVGEAEQLAQLLSNRGYVIDYTGTIQPRMSGIYIPSPNQFPQTIAFLQELYPTITSKGYSQTADISIIIGKDFALYHF